MGSEAVKGQIAGTLEALGFTNGSQPASHLKVRELYFVTALWAPQPGALPRLPLPHAAPSLWVLEAEEEASSPGGAGCPPSPTPRQQEISPPEQTVLLFTGLSVTLWDG